jgi:polar amino acid transport system substrate-binding protein
MRLWCLVVFAIVVSTSVGAREMVLTCGEAYPPLCFVENGAVKGIEIDLMNELARRFGFTLTPRALPWARAQQQVKTGEADAFITITTPEREEYAVMSPAVLLTVHLVAATAKTNPKIAELRKIKTLRDTWSYPQVNYVGTSLAANELAGARVTYLNSTDSIFAFLTNGRADIFIDTDVILSYNAARLKLSDQVEVLAPVFQATEFRLGISKRSPFAADMPRLSRTIEAMENDGTVAAIVKKYSR